MLKGYNAKYFKIEVFRRSTSTMRYAVTNIHPEIICWFGRAEGIVGQLTLINWLINVNDIRGCTWLVHQLARPGHCHDYYWLLKHRLNSWTEVLYRYTFTMKSVLHHYFENCRKFKIYWLPISKIAHINLNSITSTLKDGNYVSINTKFWVTMKIDLSRWDSIKSSTWLLNI